MDDRRRNNRIDAFDAGLKVVNSIDGEPIGIIGNLSPGGMMLISRRELFVEGVLQLRIELPKSFASDPIPVGVKILWCTPANSPDEFWVGLKTIDIAAADHARLLALLDHLAGRQ